MFANVFSKAQLSPATISLLLRYSLQKLYLHDHNIVVYYITFTYLGISICILAKIINFHFQIFAKYLPEVEFFPPLTEELHV